jgi:hypothetical protein
MSGEGESGERFEGYCSEEGGERVKSEKRGSG